MAKRDVDLLFSVPAVLEAIARWLKDSPKRLQAEKKKMRTEVDNGLFEETEEEEEVVDYIDEV